MVAFQATFRCLAPRVSRNILLFTALKIAAKLSILGLPFDESMRCRLLLGTSVSFDSCSNPNVALTRSRRITRAVSASPLMRSIVASSRSFFANVGSRSTRATTVSLKSRVSAIKLPPWPFRFIVQSGCRFSRLVFRMQSFGSLDIGLLSALVTVARGPTGSLDHWIRLIRF